MPRGTANQPTPQAQAAMRDEAKTILKEASYANFCHVYSASGFAHRAISIVQQQRRCFNLCWALTLLGIVKSTSRVGIIGGGISGLTCAAALGTRSNSACYIFEREGRLCERIRTSSHRYINVHLTDQALMEEGSPHLEDRTHFPFLNWGSAYASEVAFGILGQFNFLQAHLPIFVALNTQISSIKTRPPKTYLTSIAKDSFEMDVVIVASGFESALPIAETASYADDSYWHSGDFRSYRRRNRGRKEKIAIVGNGDSGIIEAASYLLRSFKHREILALVPQGGLRRSLIKNWYENSTAWAIANNREYTNPHRVQSWVKVILAERPKLGRQRRYFAAILKHLDEKLGTIPDDEEGDERDSLTIGKRAELAIHKALRPHLRDLASIELADVYQQVKLSRDKSYRKIAKRFRADFSVTMYGETPSPFAPNQSPDNSWVLHSLLHGGVLKYKSGTCEEKYLLNKKIRLAVHRPNGSTRFEYYDRVARRVPVLFKQNIGYRPSYRPKLPLHDQEKIMADTIISEADMIRYFSLRGRIRVKEHTEIPGEGQFEDALLHHMANGRNDVVRHLEEAFKLLRRRPDVVTAIRMCEIAGLQNSVLHVTLLDLRRRELEAGVHARRAHSRKKDLTGTKRRPTR